MASCAPPPPLPPPGATLQEELSALRGALSVGVAKARASSAGSKEETDALSGVKLILHYLRYRDIPADVLESSGLAAAVRELSKHEDAKLAGAASECVLLMDEGEGEA